MWQVIRHDSNKSIFLMSSEWGQKFCSKAQLSWTQKSKLDRSRVLNKQFSYPATDYSDTDSMATVMSVTSCGWNKERKYKWLERSDVKNSFVYHMLLLEQHPRHDSQYGELSKVTWRRVQRDFNTAPTMQGLAPKWRHPAIKQQCLKPFNCQENARISSNTPDNSSGLIPRVRDEMETLAWRPD